MSFDELAIIQYRIERSARTLRSAHRLLSVQEDAESVVNRCYYAAFYAVLALLTLKKVTPRSHQSALELFNREFVHAGLWPKSQSRSLHILFLQRQEDDYKRLDPAPMMEAAEAFEMAFQFIQLSFAYLQQHCSDLVLPSLPPSPPPSQGAPADD